MTLGDIMPITRPDVMIDDQVIQIIDRDLNSVSCRSCEYDKWGKLADRTVFGIKAIAAHALMIFVESEKRPDEDQGIPGQMTITDYGIRGG